MTARRVSVDDAHYVHSQMIPSATWVVTHNLGKFPSVTVVDSTGRHVFGDVQYVDANNVTIIFSGAFGGKAYMN
jgi:hypothetical protein